MRLGRPTMSSLKLLNQDAEHAKRFVALAMNINAAKGLQEVLKTNLGPKVRSPALPPEWREAFLECFFCYACHDRLRLCSLPLIRSWVPAPAGHIEDVGGRRG